MNIKSILLLDAQTYEKFKSDFTYHSSAIEGSKVAEKDNTRLMDKPFDKKVINAELEIYKHDEVYENRNLGLLFDDMFTNIKQPLTKQMLCEWHQKLKQQTYWANTYQDAVGKYRKKNVEVGDSENFAMSLEYIEEHMVNFINDINYERKMQLEDICEFHCRFEKIHPFLDGNGRIGRIIMLRQCLQNNITPFIIDNDTRGEYINALKMYHKTNFASFLVEYCKKLQKIFSQKYYAKFNQKKNDRVSTIVNFIKENGFISRKDVEKLFSIKSTAAKSILNQLINKRVLVSLNEGKLSIYKLK